MKIRSGFVSNSSSSSFILDIPKDMTPEEFAEKIDKEKFSCYYGQDVSPEEFFKENFGDESKFTVDSVLDHILGQRYEKGSLFSDVLPENPISFFEYFSVPSDEWRTKSLEEIVKERIDKHNLYELFVERGTDYWGIFGELILFGG